MVKRILLFILISVFIAPPTSFGQNLGEIGKTIETAVAGKGLETSGINLNNITDYLDWELLNVSFISDFNNITALGKNKVVMEGTVFKRGINGLRVDIKSGLEVPGKEGVRLFDCHILYRILKKKAYLVFPKRNAFIEIDPDEVREMLGAIMKKSDGKPKFEKKEFLGNELFDGYDCKKIFAIMKFANGTRTSVTTWLAPDFKGLPLKIIADVNTRFGITGTNTTTFTNIKKTEPDAALFDLPQNFTRYKNLVEVATAGKFGSHRKKK